MVSVRFVVAPVCNFKFNAQPQARRAVAFAMPVEGSFIIQAVESLLYVLNPHPARLGLQGGAVSATHLTRHT